MSYRTGQRPISITEVSGNRLSDGSLGCADYRSGAITIPRFDQADGATASSPAYKAAVGGLKLYILEHELMELECEPGTDEGRHAQMEAELLERLEVSGFDDPYAAQAYAAGLALHRLRIESGDETGFSNLVSSRYDIAGKSLANAKYMEAVMPHIEAALGVKGE